MTGPTQVQATVVARRQREGWVGVALTGPSGVGKTALALNLVSQGWQLVADDAALIWTSDGRLWARPPRSIAGRVEARGLGLVSVPYRDVCRLALSVRLGRDEPERMPDPTFEPWLGVPLRTIAVQGRAAAAPRVVALALAEVLRRPVSP